MYALFRKIYIIEINLFNLLSEIYYKKNYHKNLESVNNYIILY